MKLWRISQEVNNDYDTYDSAVVAAETEDDARCVEFNHGWAHPQDVEAEYIGEAKSGTAEGIIVASFNAG